MKLLRAMGAVSIACVLASGYAWASRQSGIDAARSALDALGSKEKITERFSGPLTSSQTEMQTLSGETSFDAQLSCPSSDSFLTLTAARTATGDVGSVAVSQDINLDGIADYSYSAPLVSGACANGIISCDAGSWTNCAYYRWVANSDGSVLLETVAADDLGGCYCINASCGYDAGGNMENILLALGGGAVGAAQAVNPRLSVARADASETSITYYGQASADCTSAGTASGGDGPERFYSDPDSMEGEAQIEIAAQSGDPDSYYSIAITSFDLRGGLQQAECAIIRNYAITTQTSSSAGNVSGAICVDFDLYARITADYEIQLYAPPAAGGTCGSAAWETVISITPDPNKTLSDIQICASASGAGCDAPSTCVNGFDSSFTVTTCSDVGTHDVTYSINYAIFYEQDVESESITNGCSALESDSDCSLETEVMYDADGAGTQSVLNFTPTGSEPGESCKTFTTALDVYTICRDWWQIERTYICETSEIDLDETRSCAEQVFGAVSGDTDSMQYQDCQGSAYSTAFPDTGDYDDCESACKIRRPVQNTSASSSGNASQYQTSVDSWEIFYRVCLDNVCPTEDGDEIVTACECGGDFSATAGLLESVFGAARDIICSSGEQW